MRRIFSWKWTLAAILIAAYVPFTGSRFVRTAGDEKVYVSQAVEMARDGRWFVQTLQDSPDYYKGPLHYVFLHFGIGLFGYSPWAILFMNLLFLGIGAFALGAIVRRRYPDWGGGPVLAGTAFGLCVGVYAHSFASQMEIELAGLFALALYLLDRTPVQAAGFAFWTVAAIAGWPKAPLHSAFLGVSALLFWGLSGELLARAKNPKSWLAGLWGVGFCVLGFLPAFVADRQNFLSLYLLKEVFEKSTTHQAASVPIVSTFGFYLFPWVLLAGAAYVYFFFGAVKAIRDRGLRRLLLLVFCFCAPSVLFFLKHPYRFENYNLPVISAVILLTAVMLAETRGSRVWGMVHAILVRLTSVLFLLFPILITAAYVRFSPMPDWWPAWLLPAVWVGALLAAFSWWIGARPVHAVRLSVGALALYCSLGAFFSVLGERELVDLRAAIGASPRIPRISYVNLQRNIWSEWGILGFFIGHPVEGKHTSEALREAVLRGDLILIAHGEGRETFDRFVREHLPGARFEEHVWKRWRTHGATDSGKPLWKDAWDQRNLGLFERDYSIVNLVQ